MRIDCALLCDYATVREGLLHVLGGGITRINRPAFPAPFGCSIALRIVIHRTEADRPHKLRVILQDNDGKRLAQVDAGFGVGNPEAAEPGEDVAAALPIPMQAIMIPHAGSFSIELLIDDIHQSSVPFMATQLPIPQIGGQ